MGDVLAMGPQALRSCTKADVAEFFGVSYRTVDEWVRRGCPVVERGARGTPWKMDCRAVAKWYYGGQGGVSAAEPEDLGPHDRRAWYESELKRRQLSIMDKELIPVGDVERVMSTSFAAIAQELRALPDNLERRHGVSAETVAVIEVAILESMDALADRLEALEPADTDQSEEEGDGDSTDP